MGSPGSRVEVQRSLEEAASGRLYCLTGLRETYLEQLYTYGEPERHPPGRLVSVVYFALRACPADRFGEGRAGRGSRRLPSQSRRNNAAYRYGR